MGRFIRLLAVLSLSRQSLALLNATCYFPDGKTTDSQLLPCSISGQYSSCCREQEACLASGLCMGGLGVVYRGGCTDPTYQDGSCPKNCLKPFESQQVDLISCPGTGGQFWCGGSEQGVCNSTQQFYLKPGLVTKIQPWATAFRANFVPGATTTPGPAANSTASSGNASCSSTSGGPPPVILAVAIGVTLLVLAVTCFVWMLIERKRRKRLEKPKKPPITPLAEILQQRSSPPIRDHSSRMSLKPLKSWERSPRMSVQELPGDLVLERGAVLPPPINPIYYQNQVHHHVPHHPPEYHRSYR